MKKIMFNDATLLTRRIIPNSVLVELGVNRHTFEQWYGSIRDAFAGLIDWVSGKGTWESNPYVYVYGFELLA